MYIPWFLLMSETKNTQIWDCPTVQKSMVVWVDPAMVVGRFEGKVQPGRGNRLSERKAPATKSDRRLAEMEGVNAIAA